MTVMNVERTTEQGKKCLTPSAFCRVINRTLVSSTQHQDANEEPIHACSSPPQTYLRECTTRL